MSGSPTYAEIQLREAEERRLAEERRRRAEEERKRREEAERRARIELANRLRATLATEASSLKADLNALRVAAVEGTLAGGVPHLEPQIDAVVAAAVGGPEMVTQALGQVRATAARVTTLRDGLAKQAAAVASIQDDVRREAAQEAARLAVALTSAEASREHATINLIADLQARVAGVEADEITMAWSADEVQAVAVAIEAVRAAQDPREAARALGERLDQALQHAQVRQLAEERRAYIVSSLQQGLREQGFKVGDATIVGDEATGEVAFRAVRADRRWVDVNVPLAGHVFYDVDGTDRITERGTDGLAYTSCDETEARLEALHADLDQRFGIEAGELFWESKDPQRQRRSANELPTGGPSATRKQG
jgi:hypothetical protein